MNLPFDIKYRDLFPLIASHLDPWDVLNFRSVCKIFNKASEFLFDVLKRKTEVLRDLREKTSLIRYDLEDYPCYDRNFFSGFEDCEDWRIIRVQTAMTFRKLFDWLTYTKTPNDDDEEWNSRMDRGAKGYWCIEETDP